jgi:hypothetical protein
MCEHIELAIANGASSEVDDFLAERSDDDWLRVA